MTRYEPAPIADRPYPNIDLRSDAWADLPTSRVMSAPLVAQTYTRSTVEGRGRITPSTNDTTMRVAYLTDWASRDSQVSSIWWGQPAAPAVNMAQLWHIHRVVDMLDGSWRAIGVWYDVTVPFPWVLNLNSFKVLNQAITLGAAGGQLNHEDNVKRQTRIYRSQRLNAFGVSQHLTIPYDALRYMPTGTLVDVAGNADASFNANNLVANQADEYGLVQVVQAGADATDNLANGTMLPQGCPRWFPYRVDSRVIAGLVQARQYRLGQVPPPWSYVGAPNIGVFTPAAADPTIAPPAVAGLHGIAVAHLDTTDQYVEIGEIDVRPL